MKQALATLLLVGAVIGLGYTASAQFAGTEPLGLTINPSYPRPYQSVTVIPESNVIDLNASTVTVSVNGQVVSRGSGAEAAYVTMGGPGTVTTVTVTAVQNGQSYTKSLSIRPADVALIIEPLTTTHPFYEGAALLASEGQVRLVAVPDLRTSSGAAIPAANLIYTWKNGDQILQGQSGIGKSTLTATSPIRYRDARVTVTVSTQDRSIVAEAGTILMPATPLIRIYRNDPLLGPRFGTAIQGAAVLTGTEETFRAVPYFFPGSPSVTWTVNNTTRDTDRDITVRATGGGSGNALVRAFAGSNTEAADASFRITFGQESRGFNFFGL